MSTFILDIALAVVILIGLAASVLVIGMLVAKLVVKMWRWVRQ